MQSRTPAGYRESALGGTWLVARDDQHDAVRDTLARCTVHEWAAGRPGARALQGRGVAWATTLPSGMEVVVRHSRHGGALAAVTRDLFLAPSRAPHELAVSVWLRDAGIPTPPVIAYAVYSAFGPLCRADVVTGFVNGVDFPAAWAAAPTPEARDAIIDAVAALLRLMQAAGVRHPDLNVKNVLISGHDGARHASLLDVDRVQFLRTELHSDDFIRSAHEQTGVDNAQRLLLSVMKWRREQGLDVGDAHWNRLLDGAGVKSEALRRPTRP
jgi:hypothetical protein